MSFVTHLEGAIDGARLPARTLQTTHEGRPIVVRYDLEAIRRHVDRDAIASRFPSLWRYEELLPIDATDERISLGETMTPLLECPRLASHLGMRRLLIKDESRLPTGSFKARGMALAVTMAKALGVRHVAAPTAGNAGGALAAYAARAGMACTVYMPADTPIVNQLEPGVCGARAVKVQGLINDCGRLLKQAGAEAKWFDVSTLKEPYRLEGKKTMGLELAEQLGWSFPDVVLYPTGGGTGLIGIWKAFEELQALGWLTDTKPPRLYACQSNGCAPIVDAFERGERFANAPDHPRTVASGLRVPVAVADFMILDAVRASGGKAIGADDEAILEWMRTVGRLEGVSLCPESGACLAALEHALRTGEVGPDERVVVYNTGAVQKYVEAMRVELETVDAEGRPVNS